MLDILTVKTDIEFLRKKSEIIPEEEIPTLTQTINEMQKILATNGGVGLSACQIGTLKRMFILYDDSVYINPTVIAKSGKITSLNEGCLSIPDKFYKIKRARMIIIEYLDQHGNSHRKKFDKKLESIAVQHELDHLDGILLCDK